jgi:hypothetical protein
MPSTYANNLRLENIANGEQSGSWGDTTNKNICGLLVDAVAGLNTVSITGLTTYTLTAFNGVADESRNAVLKFTGNISAACTIYIPPVGKTYIVDNNTNIALAKQNLIIRTDAGAVAATVPFGIYSVYSDGIDSFISTNLSAGGTITGNLAVVGNETVTGTLGVTGVTTLASTLTGVLSAASGVVGTVAPGTSGNVLTSNGTAWASSANPPPFAAGTKLIFPQAAAPTGWTKDTTAAINDSILRFVTGTGGGSGGSVGVSTWAAQTATGSTALSVAQMPSHTHQRGADNPVAGLQGGNQGLVGNTSYTSPTTSAGGGEGHTHTLSQSIKYYDSIIATKDA